MCLHGKSSIFLLLTHYYRNIYYILLQIVKTMIDFMTFKLYNYDSTTRFIIWEASTTCFIICPRLYNPFYNLLFKLYFTEFVLYKYSLKMALWVSKSKFWDHFSIQTNPQNPQKDTSGTQIGPRKVIFGHFAFFWYFYLIFPLARALFFKSISTHQKLTPDKKEFFPSLQTHKPKKKTLAHFQISIFAFFNPT